MTYSRRSLQLLSAPNSGAAWLLLVRLNTRLFSGAVVYSICFWSQCACCKGMRGTRPLSLVFGPFSHRAVILLIPDPVQSSLRSSLALEGSRGRLF